MQTKSFHYRELNLPPHPLHIEKRDDHYEVFDSLRRKWVQLTDEEWVRQNFTAHLIADLGYPPSVMANEIGLTLNRTRRRADTIVFGRDGSPMIIIEFKAPTVEITQTVFDQIVRYNMTMRANILIVSNGLSHYCCLIDYTDSTYRFLPSIPSYAEALLLSGQVQKSI